MELITITIEDDMGEVLFRATSKSVDGAIAELGRYERHIKKTEPETI